MERQVSEDMTGGKSGACKLWLFVSNKTHYLQWLLFLRWLNVIANPYI